MKNQELPVIWDRLARQFFIGFVRTHILYHAAEQPVCGADLTAELARHGYRLSPGTLYPVLHELEASGYLRCLPNVRQGRRVKRYTITASGRQVLVRIRKQIKELVNEVMDSGHAG
ncbi:MAG: PadR family transcriptional regulator [Nitrospirae bacterium]|nr:PadR family transcriptional regulator [Nitrospirota bacterium]